VPLLAGLPLMQDVTTDDNDVLGTAAAATTEDVEYRLDFESQDRLASTVTQATCVSTCARGGSTTMFEDCAVVHRSPPASNAALEARRRVILRINFSVVDCFTGALVRLHIPS
jgi:hypothetical protein